MKIITADHKENYSQVQLRLWDAEAAETKVPLEEVTVPTGTSGYIIKEWAEKYTGVVTAHHNTGITKYS